MPASQRTAVVTGSSSGIGKALAMRLLRSGFRVVLNYSTNDRQAADTLRLIHDHDHRAVRVASPLAKP